MLMYWRNLEEIKDEDEDKDIVDAQRLFHQVAGKKFQASFETALVKNNQANIENDRQAQPDAEPKEGLSWRSHEVDD